MTFQCLLETWKYAQQRYIAISFLITAIAKVRRSNSWSDVVEDFKFGEEPKDPTEVERELHEQNCR